MREIIFNNSRHKSGATWMRPVRARAYGRAFRIAGEQHEAKQLADALKLVRRYERKMALREERKGRRAGDSGRANELVLPKASTRKAPRGPLHKLTNGILFHFNNALKRYLLMKRARAAFSYPCSERQFKRLIGGFADIYRTSRDWLVAEFKGEHTEDVVNVLSELLGVDEGWWSRRWFGTKLWKRRDCAYIDMIKGHASRGKITFRWKNKTLKHLDDEGDEKEVSDSRVYVQFPRNCTAVKPLRKHRHLKPVRKKKGHKKIRK